MSLRRSYTWLAPVYDLLVGPPLNMARRRSLQRLPGGGGLDILLDGIGTGLDLPLLPPGHHYTALDLTPAMLQRARMRQGRLQVCWVQGDSQRLPFADASFDHALLHLILAIVPDTVAALREAARVLRAGGRLYVLDKFIARGAMAPLRRMLNPLVRRIATRTDVVFEDAFDRVNGLRLVEDEPALAAGWFRLITLEKAAVQEDPGAPGSSGSSSSLRGQVHQTKPSSSASAAATSIRNQVSPLINTPRQLNPAYAQHVL
jgi:phosphatidylethanolamine/phosphatidyl-N-methylethanolamine N-methyltransferase